MSGQYGPSDDELEEMLRQWHGAEAYLESMDATPGTGSPDAEQAAGTQPTLSENAATDDSGNRTLYVFIDESGDFTFNEKGTDYFLMAAYMTADPVDSAAKVLGLRYELMKHPIDLPYFHATEDSAGKRKRMFDVMLNDLHRGRFHVIWVDKHLAAPPVQSRERLYTLFAGAIAKYLCLVVPPEFTQIVIVYDAAIPKKLQGSFKKVIMPQLREYGRKVQLHFDNLKYDSNGQMADYVAWAYQRHLERGDSEYWDRLRTRFGIEPFDLFRNNWGKKYW